MYFFASGGLDDALNLILELCNDQKVPFIFALGRRALGRACAKLVPVSVVGIFNYEGSEVSSENPNQSFCWLTSLKLCYGELL